MLASRDRHAPGKSGDDDRPHGRAEIRGHTFDADLRENGGRRGGSCRHEPIQQPAHLCSPSVEAEGHCAREWFEAHTALYTTATTVRHSTIAAGRSIPAR